MNCYCPWFGTCCKGSRRKQRYVHTSRGMEMREYPEMTTNVYTVGNADTHLPSNATFQASDGRRYRLVDRRDLYTTKTVQRNMHTSPVSTTQVRALDDGHGKALVLKGRNEPVVMRKLNTSTKFPRGELVTSRYHSGGGIHRQPLNETMSTEYSFAPAHETRHYHPFRAKTTKSHATTGGHLVWDGYQGRKVTSRSSNYYDDAMSPASGSVFDYRTFHRPLAAGNGGLRRSYSFTYGTAPRNFFNSHAATFRAYDSGYVRTQKPYSDRYNAVALEDAYRYGVTPRYSGSQFLYGSRHRPHSMMEYLDGSQLMDTTTVYNNGEPVRVFRDRSPRLPSRALRHDENDNLQLEPALYESATYSYPR